MLNILTGCTVGLMKTVTSLHYIVKIEIQK